MDDSNYPGYDDDSEPGEGTATDPDAAQEGSEKDRGETTLVPKTFLGPDVKVGDVCRVKVVRLHEGEAEITWVKADKEKPDDTSDEPSMARAHSQLDAMATEV